MKERYAFSFLHGKGRIKNAYNGQIRKAAENLSADVVSFNAPLPHPAKRISLFGLIKSRITIVKRQLKKSIGIL